MNRNATIVSIVEGPGDRSAVPGLLRRILHERLFRYDVSVLRPKVAGGKPALLKRLERLLRYAILEDCDAILVLVDADRECPYKEAVCVAARASALNLNVPVAVVYAKAEYETWFIANLYPNKGLGIRERLKIPGNVNAPRNVEDIGGAKGWLTRNMPRLRAYQETEDQEKLTFHIDLSLTHSRSRSFQRMCHAVEQLVDAIDDCAATVTPP